MKNYIKALKYWINPVKFIAKNPYLLYKWGKVIKARDKNCVACGSSKKLEAHHIYPKKEYPRLAFNIKNGITLCKSCHIKDDDSWHGLYGYKLGGVKKFKEWLIKKKKNISSS